MSAINRVVNPTCRVSERHRTAFVLLLDLSCSMVEPIESEYGVVSKSKVLSHISNRILDQLYMYSFSDREVRDYYDVAIIGYSGDKVFTLLGDDINNPFFSIKDLADSCRDQQWVNVRSFSPFESPDKVTYAGDSTLAFMAGGATPMYEALRTIYRLMNMWCSRYDNFDSAPPMIYHITDGHPTDCNLKMIVDISSRIKSLHTNCGDVILLNIMLNSDRDGQQLLFPTDAEIADHTNGFVQAMARASSVMPERFNPLINELRDIRCVDSYRGFGSHISVADVVSVLNIGTLSVVAR